MANISGEISEVQAASRGNEVRGAIVNALNKINSDVLPDASASDSGKILRVNSNGEWIKDSLSGYMPIPTASKSIVENGTYDVTNYAEAVVNVPSGGSGVIQPLSVSQNGTYTPSSGVDGYAPVTVNVSGGGGDSKILTPVYEGLSYAFCTVGNFNTWTTKTNYMTFFEAEANKTYCLFSANDNGNRLRANFFNGKTLNDFIQYIENSQASKTIYNGNSITGADDLTGNRLRERFFYTPNGNGIIAVLTSSNSVTVPTYMIDIS